MHAQHMDGIQTATCLSMHGTEAIRLVPTSRSLLMQPIKAWSWVRINVDTQQRNGPVDRVSTTAAK
jgi:hypothetical protein